MADEFFHEFTDDTAPFPPPMAQYDMLNSSAISSQQERLILMLLYRLCAFSDPTPRTFLRNVMRLYELGLISSLPLPPNQNPNVDAALSLSLYFHWRLSKSSPKDSHASALHHMSPMTKSKSVVTLSGLENRPGLLLTRSASVRTDLPSVLSEDEHRNTKISSISSAIVHTKEEVWKSVVKHTSSNVETSNFPFLSLGGTSNGSTSMTESACELHFSLFLKEIDGAISRFNNEYIVLEKLGDGGFGSVYKCKHKLDNQIYAVKKVVFTHTGFTDVLQRRVMREVRTLAKLNDKHVCRYYNAWVEVVMDYNEEISRNESVPSSNVPNSESSAHHELTESMIENNFEALHSHVHRLHRQSSVVFELSDDDDDSSDPDSSSGEVNAENSQNDDSMVPFDFKVDSAEDLLSNSATSSILPPSQRTPVLPRLNSVRRHTNRVHIEVLSNSASPQVSPDSNHSSMLDSAGIFLLSTRETSSKVEIHKQARHIHDDHGFTNLDNTVAIRGKSNSNDEYRFSSEFSRAMSTLSTNFNSRLALYICTEYCEQRTLRHYLKSPQRSISSTINISIFHQLLTGLYHVHSQGIVHRDLKPANIFVTPIHSTSSPASSPVMSASMKFHQLFLCKIGDFGLSKELSDISVPRNDQSTSGTMNEILPKVYQVSSNVGTRTYAAPEQLQSNHPGITTASDIYSLGLILAELYCKFSTGMERAVFFAQLRNKCELPLSFTESWPIESQLILSMVNHTPTLRPSVIELLNHPFVLLRGPDGGFSTSPKVYKDDDSKSELKDNFTSTEIASIVPSTIFQSDIRYSSSPASHVFPKIPEERSISNSDRMSASSDGNDLSETNFRDIQKESNSSQIHQQIYHQNNDSNRNQLHRIMSEISFEKHFSQIGAEEHKEFDKSSVFGKVLISLFEERNRREELEKEVARLQLLVHKLETTISRFQSTIASVIS